jgi:hypothetical protein
MSADGPSRLSPTLTTLPPELHLKIFSELDSTSICLGLTCKKFYHIYREPHPLFFNYHIPLSWYFEPSPGIDILLKEWYGKAGYKFRTTYGSKVGGPWADPAGEFMTDEELKFFRQLKDFWIAGLRRRNRCMEWGSGRGGLWYIMVCLPIRSGLIGQLVR